MNETVKKYRKTMGRIGSVLLLFLLMLYGTSFVIELLMIIISHFLPAETVTLISSLASAVFYFASFTLGAWFYHLAGKDEKNEPVRFTPRLPRNSFLIIFAGVGCVVALAVINSIAATAMGFGEAEEIFKLPSEFSSDSTIVLQFISIAIVPAFCEELLFRGVVLSNLMPYGKANAIIVSSILFGLMHGNFYQFLYATAAGVVMGAVYVLTESIWCSILLHFINNTISVVQFAIDDRFSEEYAWIILLLYEGVLIFVGIICAFFLVSKRSKSGEAVCFDSLTFSKKISPADSMRGFFVPTVLAFSIVSIVFAFSRV